MSEQPDESSLAWYEAEIDLESDSLHAKVVRLTGEHKRVLELGPATGYMSRVLRDRGCKVVAIEIHPEMAARAAAFCERVIVGDLEQLDLATELGDDRFDVVVAADVLEHLKDPFAALRAVKPFLREDGCLIASIPNIAHGSVRLALLSGDFPYSKLGLLDRTHLRFFTHRSVEALFERAGYAIGHLGRQEVLIEASEVPYDRDALPDGVLEKLACDPDALTYQFLVVAYPLTDERLTYLQERFREQADARGRLEHELEQARRALTEQAPLLREMDAHRNARLTAEAAWQQLTEVQEVTAEEVARLRREVEAQSRTREVAEASLSKLMRTVDEQQEHLDALTTRTAYQSQREAELRTMLLNAHAELTQRDEAQRQLRQRLESVQQQAAEAHEDLAKARAEVADWRSSRVYRVVSPYWWARNQISRASRRNQ